VFTTDLTDWYQNGSCPVDSLELQKHASLLMFRLFDWYQNNERDNSDEQGPTESVDRSICLALLIFMVNATEPNVVLFGPRLSKAVAKLRLSLQRVPMELWTNAPDLLFWVLTMGALGARGFAKRYKSPRIEAEMGFFREYIKLAIPSVTFDHTTSAEQLLDKMRTCPWVPSVFDERVKGIWTFMGLCGPNVMEMDDVGSSDSEVGVEDEYALGQSTTLRFFNMERG